MIRNIDLLRLRHIAFYVLLFISFSVTGCSSSDPQSAQDPKQEEPEVVNTDIVVAENKIFKHPGLLHTEEDFNRMKVNLELEPWKSGWNKLRSNSHSSADYIMKGPTARIIRGGGSKEVPEGDNYRAAMEDAHAAYLTAISWKVTGDVRYADKSIQILNAWAKTCKEIAGDSNRALGAGIYGYEFANAAEIMRDYKNWNAQDFETFKKWMVDVFYKVNYEFLETHWNSCDTHYWANWDLCNIASVMSIAVLADDIVKYKYAVNYLMKGKGNGQLIKAINYIHPKSSNDDIELGQIQESGRDQGHTLMVIGLLGTIGQTAYNQGDDIYGYRDNMILKAAEYAAKYNIARLNVPFTKYDNCDHIEDLPHSVPSEESRGNIRPIWERIYNHYTKKKGIAARYILMARNTTAPEGGSGEYDPNSGGYDDLGFGTFLYSR
ncbi:alginate lyase family protein [uncultured Flavobacterium sp.]|uniref:alginate lyase family protein n=1 Tax=uncultured Flavobacterium sp. TaxID=165435 RepID=UPI00259250F8|nr:alginate lyase family protein [uncultured Flavobacterium sp.]